MYILLYKQDDYIVQRLLYVIGIHKKMLIFCDNQKIYERSNAF